MSEFLDLLPPFDALKLLLDSVTVAPQSERIPTDESLGRVTAHPILAPHPLPEFPRSTVDGFAVRAADTYGASEGLPAYLQVSGEIAMGSAAQIELRPGQCAVIHTGGMVPRGSDGVVMVEYTQQATENEIEVQRPVSVGENVLQVGEDVASGERVIAAGTRLRPAEIGGLMALGFTEVEVFAKPRVAILSSGDEVVPPDRDPVLGQVRDINSYSLKHFIVEQGGLPVNFGIIPDKAEAFAVAARRALAENDLVVFTAGSSVSVRDLTAQTIDQLGLPGTLVHGVNVRPGKPTILAVCDGKPVIGLPGNPVSALVIAGLFVGPLVEKLGGVIGGRPPAQLSARLAVNLSSQSGREDWVGVRLQKDANVWVADPVFGKSNLIFTLARADGLLRIAPEVTGIAAGDVAEVFLL